MLNYGFDRLRLVNPECSPNDVEAEIGLSMLVAF